MIPNKRRRSAVDTQRQRCKRMSARHLRDLLRFHAAPPPDVELRSVAVPHRIEAVAIASFCASPADMCAEIA